MQGLLTKFGKRGWNTLYSKTKLQFITGQSRRLHQSPEGSLEDLFTSLDWHRRRTSWIIYTFYSKCAEWRITMSACSVAQSHCPSDASKMRQQWHLRIQVSFTLTNDQLKLTLAGKRYSQYDVLSPVKAPGCPLGDAGAFVVRLEETWATVDCGPTNRESRWVFRDTQWLTKSPRITLQLCILTKASCVYKIKNMCTCICMRESEKEQTSEYKLICQDMCL